MNNFSMLYGAELKKILARKAVWAAMAIGLSFVLLVGLTNLSADGRRAYVQYQEEVLTELSGQVMDQAFFDRYHEAVQQEIEQNWSRYERLSAYDPGALYLNASAAIGQRALYDLIYNVVRDRDQVATVTEAQFYADMRENILHDGKELGSTEEELTVWLASFDRIEKPLSYSYALAYLNILDVLFLIGWLLILNISISLSGLFADEKTCRTDALILSARNGRLPVCLAKLGAGITTALLQAAILIGVGFGGILLCYGSAGWDAPIQNVIPSSPWAITIGAMVGIYLVFAVLVSILFAETNLLISHLTQSAVATMALHAAVIFAGLFNVPAKLGAIAKLWQLRPTIALYYGSFCNTFLYAGWNNVQISLLLYTVAAAALAGVLMISYPRSQVESR